MIESLYLLFINSQWLATKRYSCAVMASSRYLSFYQSVIIYLRLLMCAKLLGGSACCRFSDPLPMTDSGNWFMIYACFILIILYFSITQRLYSSVSSYQPVLNCWMSYAFKGHVVYECFQKHGRQLCLHFPLIMIWWIGVDIPLVYQYSALLDQNCRYEYLLSTSIFLSEIVSPVIPPLTWNN